MSSGRSLDSFDFSIGRSDDPKLVDFEMSARGSFPPASTAVPKFDPDTTRCEACGTEVFLLRVTHQSIPDQQGWFERPTSAGPFTQTMAAHTKTRCQEVRAQELLAQALPPARGWPYLQHEDFEPGRGV